MSVIRLRDTLYTQGVPLQPNTIYATHVIRFTSILAPKKPNVNPRLTMTSDGTPATHMELGGCTSFACEIAARILTYIEIQYVYKAHISSMRKQESTHMIPLQTLSHIGSCHKLSRLGVKTPECAGLSMNVRPPCGFSWM